MSTVKIHKENFQKEVLDTSKPVLLDFWAPWCAPCGMLAPVVDEIARERPDIRVGKVNVDEELELAAKFGITSIPTLVLIRNGQVAATSLGYRPKAEIEKMLEL
mgnify:CR=1 FL=1